MASCTLVGDGDDANDAGDSDWMAAWQPMVDAIGRDFATGDVEGADSIELGLIRRYCEPLEMDSPIHHDRDAAQSAGYADVVAPVSSVLMFSIPAMWSPSDSTFYPTAGRDDQPPRSPVKPGTGGLAPATSGYFATDIEFDFVGDMVVGDRLRRVGNVLVACTPKRTRVGRGAFTTWQWEMCNQRDEVVARVRTTLLFYDAEGENA